MNNGSNGIDDLFHMTWEMTAPAGTHGFRFDVAWFDAEFPEYIGTNFTDAIIVWEWAMTLGTQLR